MIPLRDINPRRTRPIVNTSIVALNVLFFLWELSLGAGVQQEITAMAVIPARFLAPGHVAFDVVSIFLSMFLHAGWLHLGGNMLYLWIFGDNVEDRLGHGRYLIFYLLCGVAATWGHVLTNPASHLPSIGASGAIAGVLGAYLILFPGARVMTFIPIGFYLMLREIPAFLVLGFWFLIQIFTGVASLRVTTAQDTGGVAWFAHVGGFLAGIVLVLILARRRTPSAHG